jgi:hypothetical protein
MCRSKTEDLVREAIGILKSVGAEEACHSFSSEFAPDLPLCDYNNTLLRRLESDATHDESSWFYVPVGIGTKAG